MDHIEVPEDDDEDSLPKHPQSAIVGPSRSRPTQLLLRERSYQYDLSSNNSSDGPFFSSDDLAEATLEDYTPPFKRKRIHKRKWWGVEGRSKKPARYVDSGIFMASSDSGTDDGFPVDVLHGHEAKRECRSVISKPGKSSLSKSDSTEEQRSRAALLNDEDDLISAIIDDCVEDGNETIDLSNRSIRYLKNSILEPLRYLIRLPKFDKYTEGSYQALKPALQIYLASNRLERMPSVLCNMENLTVLSLRNNKLPEIPSSIGKLANLIELNVSGNKLRYLPWEILKLFQKPQGKMFKLIVFPNPFFQPMEYAHRDHGYVFPTTLRSSAAKLQQLEDGSEPSGEILWLQKLQRELHQRMLAEADETSDRSGLRMRSWKHQPVFLARTNASFLEIDGSIRRQSSCEPPSRLTSRTTIVPAIQQSEKQQPQRLCGNSPSALSSLEPSRAPSLFELALSSFFENSICRETEIHNNVWSHSPKDFHEQGRTDAQDSEETYLPKSLQMALDVAREVRNTEGEKRKCSVCARRFIQHRAEWLEYWHCGPETLFCSFEELFLPFIRRSCSWNCV